MVAGRRTLIHDFASGPTRSATISPPGRARRARRGAAAHVLPVAGDAEAPVRAAQRRRQPVGGGQQRVRLDRERERGRLDPPAAADAADLGRERRAPLGRDVLDDRARVDEVERAVVERQALGRVGAHERPGVGRALDEVDAGDVEVGLERAQAERAAADVEDPRRPAPAPVSARKRSWRRARARAARRDPSRLRSPGLAVAVDVRSIARKRFSSERKMFRIETKMPVASQTTSSSVACLRT